ncbi:hypothetical protein HY36_12675 [Hyphomonas atlantica]|uniref:Uncharacterized protein n=1 Tax=Hyphomonas atlantica TaxID=1280948 RepID=A0A059E9T3_9PROT|nr:hypothetical protein HY36_12675 [Hyphomonas atlantica]
MALAFSTRGNAVGAKGQTLTFAVRMLNDRSF